MCSNLIKLKKLLFILFILSLLLCLYYPFADILPFGDDYIYIFGNFVMAKANHPLEFWNPSSTYFKSWPLSYSILWLENFIFDENYSFYRILNLIFHILNTLIIFKILKLKKVKESFLFSLVFLFSTFALFTVSWIFQIKTILSCFFILLAVFLFLKKRKKTSLFLYILSLITKTSGVLAIFSALNLRSLKGIILSFISVFFSFITIYGLTNGQVLNFFYASPHHFSSNFSIELIVFKLKTALTSISFFLIKFLGLMKFQIIYDYNTISMFILILMTFPIMFITIDLKKNINNIFAKLFILTLLPVIGIFMIPYHKFSPYSDHWFYLPSAFFILYLATRINMYGKLIVSILLFLNITYLTISSLQFQGLEQKLKEESKINLKNELRIEYLIEIYKYQRNYKKALELSINNYDIISRKEILLKTIRDLAVILKSQKAFDFYHLKKAYRFFEAGNKSNSKEFLDKISNEKCMSFCKILREKLSH